MKTIIPPKRGRPTKKLPNGKCQKRMATYINKEKYGQRWQVETVNSTIKRVLESFLRARKVRMQNREMIMRVITRNVMILWKKFFYRASHFPFQ